VPGREEVVVLASESLEGEWDYTFKNKVKGTGV
jgi:hypothetical protein